MPKYSEPAPIAACIIAHDFNAILHDASGNAHDWKKDGRLSGSIDVKDPPVSLAFDVFARADGIEYKMGTLCVAKQSGNNSTGVSCLDVKLPLPKVDIILRASAAAARGTMDMTEIWKGEIVIKDVVVKQPATPGPSH